MLDDLTILVACDPSINKTITKKINEELAKLQKGKSSIVVNDIFQFLRIVNMDRLKETIKTMLTKPYTSDLWDAVQVSISFWQETMNQKISFLL